MSRRIYLDLDGVMADFDGTFPSVFGLDHRDLADDAMWLHINGHPSFFRDLPPMNGAVEFFRTIEHLDPIILTACPKSNYAHVATQKVEWVRAHLSAHVTVLPVLGGSSKPLFMHAKGDILIDDFRRNTEAWATAGGHAILHRGFDGTAAALEEAIGSYAPKATQHAGVVAYLHDVVHNETGETDAALSFSALSFSPDDNMGYRSVGHVPLYRGLQPVEAVGVSVPRLDQRLDSNWIAGAQFGYMAGETNDHAGFDAAVEARRRDIREANADERGAALAHPRPTGDAIASLARRVVSWMDTAGYSDDALPGDMGKDVRAMRDALGNRGYAGPTGEQAGEVVAHRYYRLEWRASSLTEWKNGANVMSPQELAERGYGVELAYAQPRPMGVPDGWKLVPVKAMREVTEAGRKSLIESSKANVTYDTTAAYAYEEMVAAAPAPAKAGGL